jgi:hypothetical protein
MTRRVSVAWRIGSNESCIFYLRAEILLVVKGRVPLGAMSTPAMALSLCLRNALVSFWMLWCATFVVTR